MERAGEVTLRRVEPADVTIFFEHQLDPEANRMGAFTPRDRDDFMAHWTKILKDESVTTRTVLVDGEVAGNVVSFERGGHREVGYWIGREHWGKGVATRALWALLQEITTRPLYARVALRNEASLRVLQKCGFTTSGQDTGPDGVEEFILRLDQ